MAGDMHPPQESREPVGDPDLSAGAMKNPSESVAGGMWARDVEQVLQNAYQKVIHAQLQLRRCASQLEWALCVLQLEKKRRDDAARNPGAPGGS